MKVVIEKVNGVDISHSLTGHNDNRQEIEEYFIKSTAKVLDGLYADLARGGDIENYFKILTTKLDEMEAVCHSINVNVEYLFSQKESWMTLKDNYPSAFELSLKANEYLGHMECVGINLPQPSLDTVTKGVRAVYDMILTEVNQDATPKDFNVSETSTH